jgi:penicillin-binding protein 1A
MKSVQAKINSNTKYILIMWGLFVAGLLFVVLFFYGVSKGMLGEMPDFHEIENPDSYLATEIYSSDGVVLGKYYSQNRSMAKYEELPQNLVNALIATEDVRFEKHSGIDFRALLRAVFNLGSAGGGSTISQQLAKNLFRTREQEIRQLEADQIEYKRTFLEKLAKGKVKTIFSKFKELIIALKLEKQYTKEEILVMYLNTVEFSDNAFGIKAATKTYFNKPIDSLYTEEAAVLVGMLKAPYTYNPRVNPVNSINRRNVVLFQMYNYNFLSKTEKDSLQALPLTIDFQKSDHVEGLAPYFRENLRLWLRDWAQTHQKSDGTHYNIYKDGLKIYTTINSKMQEYAEKAAREHLEEMQAIFFEHWKNRDPWEYYDKFDKEANHKSENLKLKERLIKTLLSRDTSLTETSAAEYIVTPKSMSVWTYRGNVDTTMSPLDSVKYYRMFLQTGFMAMDPKTGYVKAWVGGANYEHFQYDHVNINTKRQIGSTFKPFIYTLAIKEKGYSPCFQIPNELVTFDSKEWNLPADYTPKNSDNKYGGMLSLKEGLARSVNTVTAYLMHELSPQAVINLVRQMGVKSHIDPFPSMCLGVADISVIEMVGAYTAFANKGIFTEPIFISRIEDKHGNIIEEFYPEKNEALDEETSYVMTQILRNTIDGTGGTGQRVRFKYQVPYTLEIAGKTGTTQSNSDGWFMGYTPELVAGSWVGCSDRFVRFRTTQYGQGASTALPIWAKFMKMVYEDTLLNYNVNAKFEKPVKELSVELDCNKFKQSTTGKSLNKDYD